MTLISTLKNIMNIGYPHALAPEIETGTASANDPLVYRAYRLKWREDYKALAAEILALKITIKKRQKAGDYAGSEQSRWVGLSRQATEMLADLAERKAAFKEAQAPAEAA